jgi:hypothetical protein
MRLFHTQQPEPVPHNPKDLERITDLEGCIRCLVRHGTTVMDLLEEHGHTILPHLLNGRDNSGYYLREAIKSAREMVQ